MESVLAGVQFNTTMPSHDLPPLPPYTLTLAEPYLPPIADKYLALIGPIVGYWALSMIFHFIDEFDLFPQYRLHTPAEVLKRNRVSRYEVVRDVVIQQLVQTAMGVVLAYYDPDQYVGKDDYDVAVWAQRIRVGQRALPMLFTALGLDAKGIAQRTMSFSPTLSAIMAGGNYPWLFETVDGIKVPTFASWEMAVATFIHWLLIPAVRFSIAIVTMDTWQYFLHRAMHLNKWLYTTFHSRHHRLYVPYAYGALYNHPVEGFLLDTCGAALGYTLAGLTPKQTIWFFTGSTIKTVDDHCGYALPFDPLQHLTSNNAGYHDVHHQSWGIKTNFSQPYFTFWDKLMGTQWTGGDVSLRYERAKVAAQKKVDDDHVKPITGSEPSESTRESMEPYENEINNAQTLKKLGKDVPKPQIPAGKAQAQAAGSREQILQDKSAGGQSVLEAETAEEENEAKMLRSRGTPSPQQPQPHQRRRTLTSESTGLRGITERVSNLPGACFK